MLLHSPLTSPFRSVGEPQLPCSPQPQANTSPVFVTPRQCSLPAANAVKGGRFEGGSCPWSSLPHAVSRPDSKSTKTLPQDAPACFHPNTELGALLPTPKRSLPAGPRRNSSPFEGCPKTQVKSLPQTAFTAEIEMSSILDGFQRFSIGAPSCPLRPFPHPQTWPFERTATTCPIHDASFWTVVPAGGKPSICVRPSAVVTPGPSPNSPELPEPQEKTWWPFVKKVAFQVAATLVHPLQLFSAGDNPVREA